MVSRNAQFRTHAVFTRITSRIRRLFYTQPTSPVAASLPPSPATTLVGSDCEVDVKPDAFLSVSDDLLEKILVEGNSRSALDDTTNKLPFELTVSHVARRWRLVSINSLSLWTRIDTRSKAHQQLEAFDEYLRRSQDQPLDLRVDLSRELWDTNGPLLFRSLAANVHRWRRLSITTDFKESQQIIREWLRFLYPSILEHFSIICLDVEELPIIISDSDFSPQVFIFGSPALSVIRLQGIGMHLLRPPLAPITTLHLEELRYAAMSYGRFHAMIKALPCLTHLSIYGNLVAVWPRQRIHIDKIPMLALQSLRSYGDENLCDLLLAITAPRLECLILDDLRHIGLHRMCIQSPPMFPCLRSLTCGSCEIRPLSSDISHIFSVFPSIMHFTSLTGRSGTWSFLYLLQNTSSLSSPPSRWHDLRTITVHGIHEWSVETDILCKLVKARAVWGRSIEKIRLHSDSMEFVDVDKLRQVVEVEEWRSLERWPMLLSYDDEDDFFLRLPRNVTRATVV